MSDEAEVRELLAQLRQKVTESAHGNVPAAVSLLTGLSLEELDELGGFSEWPIAGLEPDLTGWDGLKAANLPSCPQCGQPIEPGQWIVGDGSHEHCP
jgi:hypothetical protein